ncbi:MAG TPA: radical SAM protein [Parafilimonas sp.]|nr:radical SAM protein [Parafilimonas sp.]
MQTITVAEKGIPVQGNAGRVIATKAEKNEPAASPMIHGWHKSFIKLCMWAQVLLLNFFYYKNPVKAFRSLNRLRKLRSDFRGNRAVLKYARVNGKYYFTFNAPGFPSKAFNKYVLNNIKKADATAHEITLDTILFGITKKCGYQCEHCFEWNTLNKPEMLSREDLLSVIASFQRLGITQVQLSGGEPLNRFDDIVYLLQNIKKGTEVWLYTSGYHFTSERAAILKQEGLTGITVSLDHWIPELHNNFRGRYNAFEWAEKAVAAAKANNLVACLSLCATKAFITQHNLFQYAALAKQWGVSFIQVLEPRAVGHYTGKDVFVSAEQVQLLEDFFMEYNYNKAYTQYPLIVYHGFYSRHVSCGGGGRHYVYVDTDGDVHNCPFCQRKIFSALHDNIEHNLRLMKMSACNVFK